MAVPDFLSHGFRYTIYNGVTDVSTVIAALNTELVTNGAWTDTGGTGVGPFKCPVNAIDGSFITITVVRVSQGVISYQVFDHQGLAVTGGSPYRQDITIGGTSVVIYSGPDYVFVESLMVTPEVWACARMNVWPETPGIVRTFFAATYGPCNSSGTTVGRGLLDWLTRHVTTTAYTTNTDCFPHVNYNNATPCLMVSASGANIYAPFEFIDANLLYGRIPQAVVCQAGLAFGTIVTLPLDTGVTGNFRVISLITALNRRLAVRVA